MITLAFVTPLGVIIGMIITEYVDSDSSANQFFIIGLLQGLAGGTLLYITFFEVLDKEKLSKLGFGSLYGCFLLILGFGIMAGLEAAGNVWVKKTWTSRSSDTLLQFVQIVFDSDVIYNFGCYPKLQSCAKELE